MWSEDKCLCPISMIKEYIARTKGREQWSVKIFIARKMSLAVMVSRATITSWLEEPLTLVNIKASGVTTVKTAIYTAGKGTSIKTIIKVCEWVHTSTMYGYYIKCLAREVLARILKQLQHPRVNVARMATVDPIVSRRDHLLIYVSPAWDLIFLNSVWARLQRKKNVEAQWRDLNNRDITA